MQSIFINYLNIYIDICYIYITTIFTHENIRFFFNCVKEINNNSIYKNNSHNNSKYLYLKKSPYPQTCLCLPS